MIKRNERGALVIEWQAVVAVVVFAVLVTLIQVFVASSIKRTTDQSIKDAVAAAIKAHDQDAGAHDNLRLLNEIDQRQQQAIERSTATWVKVDDLDARVDQIQKGIK